jgi:serine/threonine protein phosphatase PrpC
LTGGSSCPNPEEEQLGKIINEINFRILREADAEPNLEGMGTTLTLCWLKGNELTLANVGDSRLYRLRNNALEQLSKDQSPVGRLLREGRITVEESRTHPHRNVIDQAVGSHPEGIDPEFASFPMDDGDIYLLCSDGLNEELWDHEIAETLLDALRAEKPLIGAAEDLVANTLLAGGKDNVTIILLKVGVSS